jgi:aldose sugar dehydrogenase
MRNRKYLRRLLGGSVLTMCLFLLAPLHADVAIDDRVVEQRVKSDKAEYRVVRVVRGLEHPWAVDWLPDGRMIVTERPGRMYLIDFARNRVSQLNGLPEIDTDEDQKTAPQGGNQGGLLDVAVHPDYGNNGWIYFTYSSPGDDDFVLGDDDRATGTALARARINDDGTELTDMQIIYVQSPRTTPGRHYGSRIIFPGDGTVMFSIGDRGQRFGSQDLTDPSGSMIRIKEPGGAVDDNPFVNVPPGNLRPEIFSFGHRNNQGVAINPADGEIWATDHGPFGGDLLYRVQRGRNYGWPQVAHGVEYSTKEPIGIGREAPGVVKPVRVWKESKAPSGLTFYAGDAFPGWKGSLFAGFLLTEDVIRIELKGDEIVAEEQLLREMIGRIRDVAQGPDGNVYVVTDQSDGGVYRIEPAKSD